MPRKLPDAPTRPRYTFAVALFELTNERREREHEMRAAGRLPPGQSLTLKWPVLHAGSVPRFDPRTWDFRVFGLVEELLRLSWEEFSNLPQSEVFADMHCVTRWSRFDNHWGGLLATELMKRVKLRPQARHVMVHAEKTTRQTCQSRIFCARRRFSPCGMTANPLRLSTATRCASWCHTSMRGRA